LGKIEVERVSRRSRPKKT